MPRTIVVSVFAGDGVAEAGVLEAQLQGSRGGGRGRRGASGSEKQPRVETTCRVIRQRSIKVRTMTLDDIARLQAALTLCPTSCTSTRTDVSSAAPAVSPFIQLLEPGVSASPAHGYGHSGRKTTTCWYRLILRLGSAARAREIADVAMPSVSLEHCAKEDGSMCSPWARPHGKVAPFPAPMAARLSTLLAFNRIAAASAAVVATLSAWPLNLTRIPSRARDPRLVAAEM